MALEIPVAWEVENLCNIAPARVIVLETVPVIQHNIVKTQGFIPSLFALSKGKLHSLYNFTLLLLHQGFAKYPKNHYRNHNRPIRGVNKLVNTG